METGTKQVSVRDNAELPYRIPHADLAPRKYLISSAIPLNPTKSHLKNKSFSPRFSPSAPVELSRIHRCPSVVQGPITNKILPNEPIFGNAGFACKQSGFLAFFVKTSVKNEPIFRLGTQNWRLAEKPKQARDFRLPLLAKQGLELLGKQRKESVPVGRDGGPLRAEQAGASESLGRGEESSAYRGRSRSKFPRPSRFFSLWNRNQLS